MSSFSLLTKQFTRYSYIMPINELTHLVPQRYEWPIFFFGSMFQYLVVGTLLAWIIFDRRREIRRMLFGAMATAFLSRLVLAEIIRVIWHRPRPFVAENFIPLIPHDASASFPSGHAAFFFGIAFFILFCRPRASILFFIAAILIGTARVLAGIHYTTDVFGGAAVGLLAAVIIQWCITRIFVRTGE